MNWREQDKQYPPSMVSVPGDIDCSAKRSHRGASQSGQIRPLDAVPRSASMPRGLVARRSARRCCARRRSTPVRASGYLASAWDSSRRSLTRRSRPERRSCPERSWGVSLLIDSRHLPVRPSPGPPPEGVKFRIHEPRPRGARSRVRSLHRGSLRVWFECKPSRPNGEGPELRVIDEARSKRTPSLSLVR